MCGTEEGSIHLLAFCASGQERQAKARRHIKKKIVIFFDRDKMASKNSLEAFLREITVIIASIICKHNQNALQKYRWIDKLTQNLFVRF